MSQSVTVPGLTRWSHGDKRDLSRRRPETRRSLRGPLRVHLRIAGDHRRSRSRDAKTPSSSNALCRQCEGSELQKRRGGACFRCRYAHFASQARKNEEIRKRNADRRSVSCPHQRVRFAPRECRLAPTLRCGRARLSAFHHGSSLGTIHRQGAASGHASGDLAERRSCCVPLPGEEPTQFMRALPAPTCPFIVQRAPRGPVRSAGMLMPEAARERIATPRAGTALAPTFGMPPEGVLASEI